MKSIEYLKKKIIFFFKNRLFHEKTLQSALKQLKAKC